MRVFLIVCLIAGCSRGAAPPFPFADALPPSPQTDRRVVAVGDLHGDLAATRRVLTLAGVLGPGDRWVGGKTLLVQTGDVLDRGDGEEAIYELLWGLQRQAPAAGGQVVLLNGNHEIMNAQGDLRYVTPGGFADFAPAGASSSEALAARRRLFAPGGPWATRLAQHDIIAVVEGSVFVHGGVLPHHARYGIAKINAETRAWLAKERGSLPPIMAAADAPIWVRGYSLEVSPATCATLQTTLDLLGAQRMVVGHTVQPDGPTSACDGKVWRIDVGLAAHYGGKPAALEIKGGVVRVLRPPTP